VESRSLLGSSGFGVRQGDQQALSRQKCRRKTACGPGSSVQAVGDRVEVVLKQAGVHIEGHRRVGVTKHALHGLEVGGDGETSRGVPQLVRRQFAQPSRVERRIEYASTPVPQPHHAPLGEVNTRSRHGMNPMGSLLRLLAIGLAIFVCLVSACATPERPNGEDEAVPMSPQSCDDAESISGIPPAQLVADLGAEIPPRVAGEGRIFFIAPAVGSWADSAERRGTETSLKVGIWVNDVHEPEMSVTSENDENQGRIEFAPTSEGLPGFLPTGIYFPGPGCWRVTAVLGGDTATINVAVP